MFEKYSRKKAKNHYNQKYEGDEPVKFYYADKYLVAAIMSKFDLGPDTRVLDIPSGTGRFSHFFERHGVDAYGVDISKTGIHRGKQKYPGPEFAVGDGLALPFKRGSFDFVFCHGFSLFNEPDLEKVRPFMESVLPLLRSDGLFLFGKTSSLTNQDISSRLNPYTASTSAQQEDNDSSRYDHSFESYLELFGSLDDATVVGAYASIPHFFIPLREYAFSSVLTSVLSKLALTTGVPVRVYIFLRKE